VETIQALVQRVQRVHRERMRDATATDWLLRVTLRGPCPLANDLANPDQIEELEHVMAERLDVRDAEVRARSLVPLVDPDAYRDETHLAAEVLDLIDRARSDDGTLDAVAPNALAGVPDEAPESRRAYLRSLLDGLDREAIARLVDE